MKRTTPILCALLTSLCAPLPTMVAHAAKEIQPPRHSSSFDSWDELAFKIEDTKCRIGIAAVKLSVSELKPKDGNLIATYAINVPLSKSNNDTGLIVLPIDMTVDELSKRGGVLRGTAHSNKEGSPPNTIICEVRPLDNKGIILEIITSKRTLNFESRYSVIESGTGS
mgnify:CR=1 FL=1